MNQPRPYRLKASGKPTVGRCAYGLMQMYDEWSDICIFPAEQLVFPSHLKDHNYLLHALN